MDDNLLVNILDNLENEVEEFDNKINNSINESDNTNNSLTIGEINKNNKTNDNKNSANINSNNKDYILISDSNNNSKNISNDIKTNTIIEETPLLTKNITINKDNNFITKLNVNRRNKNNLSSINTNKLNNKAKNTNKSQYEIILNKLHMGREINDKKFNRNTVKTQVINKLLGMQTTRINKILHNGIETFSNFNDVVSDMTINIDLSNDNNQFNYNKEKFETIIKSTLDRKNPNKIALFDIVITKNTETNTYTKEVRHVLVVNLKYNIVKMIHIIPYLQDFLNLKQPEKFYILNSISSLMPTINSIALDSNPGKYKGIIYLNPYDILNYLDRQGNQLKKCFDKKTCIEWSILISILLLRKNICSLYDEKDELISLFESMLTYKSQLILRYWNIIDDNIKTLSNNNNNNNINKNNNTNNNNNNNKNNNTNNNNNNHNNKNNNNNTNKNNNNTNNNTNNNKNNTNNNTNNNNKNRIRNIFFSLGSFAYNNKTYE